MQIKSFYKYFISPISSACSDKVTFLELVVDISTELLLYFVKQGAGARLHSFVTATPDGASGQLYTPTAVVTRKYLQFVLGQDDGL